MRRFSVILLIAWPAVAHSQQIAYPPTERGEVADDYFGRAVPDPYRWMEELDSPATKSWVEAENAVTFGYLAHLPQRDSIRERLTALWNYPRMQIPVRQGGQIFFRMNSGLQKQSVLYRQASLTGEPRLVLDPNQISPDGTLAVGGWWVSPDGRYLAFTTAQGGSDLQDIQLRELTTGRDLDEVVPRIKFSGVSWTQDSKGFFYSRFKGSREAANLEDANSFHQVWYHSLGSAEDRLVFERPDNPNDGVGGFTSDDGRWLFISAGSGTSNNRLWIGDLAKPRSPNPDPALRVIASEEDAVHVPLGVVGRTLYLYTTWQAPKGRIVAVALDDSTRSRWRDVIPEGPDAMSEELLVGNRIAVVYLVDVQSRLRLFDLTGTNAKEVKLPEPGTVAGLSGRNQDSDFFFAFGSYLRPTTAYHYNTKTGGLTPFHPAKTPFDASRYETRATFYRSKDGTRIPIFITARKGLSLDGGNVTLLYGYGGFTVSLQPFCSPSIAEWLELGGVYAVANLRGGSEYGEEWHHAGMRANKQNVFDDFISAAQFLVSEGYTSPQTGGRFWAEEYGSSEDSTAVPYLLAYSPLHNLKPGTCYPATLVTTADHDDRVVPSHSFKFAATLQAAQGCPRPTLIRIETQGSHGYRPTNRIIAEIADEFAFALANLNPSAP